MIDMPATPIIEITCRRCGKKVMRHAQAKYCEECYKHRNRERDRLRQKHAADKAVTKSAKASHNAIIGANGEAKAVGMSYGQGTAYLKIREELEYRKQRFKEEHKDDKQSINCGYEP